MSCCIDLSGKPGSIRPMKLPAWLMACGLAALTLQAQTLTLVVDRFSLEGDAVPTLADLEGKEPVASQSLTVSPGQEQVVKTKVGRSNFSTRVMVTPVQEQYAVALELEWVEQGEDPPYLPSRIATQTRVKLKLNRPQLVIGTSESVRSGTTGNVPRHTAVRVTLAP